MEEVAILLCWLLALVFAGAAVAKAARWGEFVETVGAIVPATPDRLRAVLAGATILVELGCAALLLTRPVAGALVAIAALAVFAAVAEYVVRSGRRVTCACFGDFGRAALGRRTQLRNLALAIVAAAVLGSAAGVAAPVSAGWLGLAAVTLATAGFVSVRAGILARDLAHRLERQAG